MYAHGILVGKAPSSITACVVQWVMILLDADPDRDFLKNIAALSHTTVSTMRKYIKEIMNNRKSLVPPDLEAFISAEVKMKYGL